jgi:hypothetical protein
MRYVWQIERTTFGPISSLALCAGVGITRTPFLKP